MPDSLGYPEGPAVNTMPIPQARQAARIHDMDRVRIERALRHRVRYLYVQPQI